MDINQKLKQRRIKIEIEKKHRKSKLLKSFNKNNLSDNTNTENFIEKIQKLEALDKKHGLITDENTNTEQKQINIRPKEIKNKNEIKEVKSNPWSKLKNKPLDSKQETKPFDREEYNLKRKKQYKKLTKTNFRGQPIMKNKIEYLFNKIKTFKK